MNDFEHGQAQTLANVDAILLETMRPLIGVDLATYRMLAALRRRINTLQLPATELRPVGEYPELPLDPPPAKRWRLIGTPFEITIDPDILESL